MSIISRLLDWIRGWLEPGNGVRSNFRYPVPQDLLLPDERLQTLQSLRSIGDTLADDVVRSVVDSTPSAEVAAKSLFDKLIRNSSPIPEDAPPELAAYFAATDNIPDHYIDHKKFAIAQKLFADLGPEIVLILFCKSLPFCYACGFGAEVLTKTGRMVETGNDQYKRLNRRIMETAQFVINVLAPGSFGDSGKAIATTQKIRLIHASIRYFIIESGWDKQRLGEPINQEDMAGTLMSFSFVILEGLIALGLLDEDKPADQEKIEAYLYLWNTVGFVLGVDPSNLPRDYQDAKKIAYSIFSRQARPSEAGRLLTKSLLDYMQHMIPGKWFDRFPVVVTRYLISDDVADMLGIPRVRSPWWHVAVPLARKFFGDIEDWESRSGLFCKVSEKFSRLLLQSVVLYHNDFKQVRFYIPPSLKNNWNIDEP
jgi:hypothetical protein